MCIVSKQGPDRLCVVPRENGGGVHLNVTDITTGHQTANVTLDHEQLHELRSMLKDIDSKQHSSHSESYSWNTPR